VEAKSKSGAKLEEALAVMFSPQQQLGRVKGRVTAKRDDE